MNAETRLHFPLQRSRPGPEAVVGIVRAPLDHLDAVQVLRHAGQRDVTDGDTPAGPTQMIPERLSFYEVACVTPIQLVGARPQLDEAVDAVAGRRYTSVRSEEHTSELQSPMYLV